MLSGGDDKGDDMAVSREADVLFTVLSVGGLTRGEGGGDGMDDVEE